LRPLKEAPVTKIPTGAWFVVFTVLFAIPAWCSAQQAQSETPSITTAPVRLPEMQVVGTNTLAEDMPIGPNQQPEWTARRRFTTTHVYVQPPWQADAELGIDTTYGRGDAPSTKFTQEFELGLPYRLQVDYEVAEVAEPHNDHYDSSSFELRWALADWNKIPLNPTLKAEWRINNGDADT
jgi:hypothetical protein